MYPWSTFHLMQYDGAAGPVEDVFCLSFSLEREEYGRRTVVELKPGGADIMVTGGFGVWDGPCLRVVCGMGWDGGWMGVCVHSLGIVIVPNTVFHCFYVTCAATTMLHRALPSTKVRYMYLTICCDLAAVPDHRC